MQNAKLEIRIEHFAFDILHFAFSAFPDDWCLVRFHLLGLAWRTSVPAGFRLSAVSYRQDVLADGR
jgi:hypothetical protein